MFFSCSSPSKGFLNHHVFSPGVIVNFLSKGGYIFWFLSPTSSPFIFSGLKALFPQLSQPFPPANFSSGPFSQACLFSPAASKANELLALRLGPGPLGILGVTDGQMSWLENIPKGSFWNDRKGSGNKEHLGTSAAQGSKTEHNACTWLVLQSLLTDFLSLSKTIGINNVPVHFFPRYRKTSENICKLLSLLPESFFFFFYNKIAISI